MRSSPYTYGPQPIPDTSGVSGILYSAFLIIGSFFGFMTVCFDDKYPPTKEAPVRYLLSGDSFLIFFI